MTKCVQHFFFPRQYILKALWTSTEVCIQSGRGPEVDHCIYFYFFHFECSVTAVSQKASPQLKPTLFLDFHCSVGCHSRGEKRRRKTLIGYCVFVMRSSLNEWMKLGDKLTQSPESVPTGRPGSLCFVPLPTGAGRGRRWSTQPRWALRKNLQILIKRHIAGWKADVKLSGFIGLFCVCFFFRPNVGKHAALLSVLVY